MDEERVRIQSNGGPPHSVDDAQLDEFCRIVAGILGRMLEREADASNGSSDGRCYNGRTQNPSSGEDVR